VHDGIAQDHRALTTGRDTEHHVSRGMAGRRDGGYLITDLSLPVDQVEDAKPLERGEGLLNEAHR
jgi:hypothetical protein